jgi:hypothetical protein
MEAVRNLDRNRLFAALVVIVVVAEFAAYMLDVGNKEAGDDADVVAWLAFSAWGIAVGAAIVYGVLPRVLEPGTVGLVLAVAALASVIAFWSALPFALGVPALHLGAQASGREGSTGVVATGLAGAAIIAGFVLCVIG